MKPFLFLAALLFAVLPARAEVTRVEVISRTDLGVSGYEKIIGRLHFAVDPRHERNRVIADLDLAPVNAAGRVEFSSDLVILRPKNPAAPNGAAIVEVSNRGGKGLLTNLHRSAKADPATEADLGDGFLTKAGYTLVWVGWEFDVPATPGLLRIEVPYATDHGKPITGQVRALFLVDAPAKTYAVTDLAAYPPLPPDHPSALTATLTLGATPPRGSIDPQKLISSREWSLSGSTVTLPAGFEPGQLYELTYSAQNPPIAGLGFAAIRDATAWLKAKNDILPPVRITYGFGISQSGRFLRDFLYHGFNTDERDRPVFDGVIAHIAGAARIDLNRRWSTPRSLGRYPVAGFPFADAALPDPSAAGVREGLLENPRVKHVPKIFYTNTSVEYVGGGRVAALIHLDPSNFSDLTLPATTRAYTFAGTQHGPSAFPPPAPKITQERTNPANYWWFMRALFPAMHAWVTEGTAPPASAYPTFREKTLVMPGPPPANMVALELAAGNVQASFSRHLRTTKLPGFASLSRLSEGSTRLSNPFLPNSNSTFFLPRLWISQIDADGNELGGLRLPEIAVPLATYTGWNFRAPAAGHPEDLVMLMGSWLPFPRTKEDRLAAKDPRPAIAERYRSREDYFTQIEAAAQSLVQQRYLLAADLPLIYREALTRWDWLMQPPAP